MKKTTLVAKPTTADVNLAFGKEQTLPSKMRGKDANREPMTAEETERFEVLRKQVHINFATGYEATVAIGAALIEIKARDLYRAQHSTWNKFLAVEFHDLKQNYASRHIRTAELDAVLREIGVAAAMYPTTESQARELVNVPKEHLLSVIGKAHELAGQISVTAGHFRQAASEFVEPPAPRVQKTAAKPASSEVRVKFDADTGKIILMSDSKEQTKAMSLSDFIQEADIPEEVVREALSVCFDEEPPVPARYVEDRDESPQSDYDYTDTSDYNASMDA